MFYSSTFKPAWWLRNSHAQTILAKYLQKSPSPVQHNEILELPDGDFTELAWTELPDNNNPKTIVVLLHGLAGCQHSHYVTSTFKALKKNNCIGVLMHFRGCNGKPNRQLNSYHSGDIRDIGYFTEHLRKNYPNHKLALVGFSLGGNVVTRYLATTPNNPYLAACVICAPLDLAACSDKLNNGLSKIYQHYLLALLKKTTLEKLKILPSELTFTNNKNPQNILPSKVKALTTIRALDNYITAPLNGFNSADDYYKKMSGKYCLPHIKQPCLILHSKDDPFMEHQKNIELDSLPDTMRFEISQYGGHVGFISGHNPFKPVFWLETRITEFLNPFIK